jgi:two-component system, sensor histidine kinase and response regulator
MEPKRILVVEDSPTQAMRLQHLLKSANMDSLLAQSAADAIKRLEQDTKWDAILSDIDMPEINGFELCQTVKKMPAASKIPFILLVSLKDTNDVLRAIGCGADNMLMKEYDKGYFLPQLLNMCESAEHERGEISDGSKRIFWDGQWHEIQQPSCRLATILVSAFTMAVHQKAARQPVSTKA